MNFKRTVLCLTVALVALPATASAKSQYGLRLGDSISIQGELAPTLFAGNSCVEVVAAQSGEQDPHRDPAGVTEIRANREYWQMAMFTDRTLAELEASKPSLVLRDLATGDEVRMVAGTGEGNGSDPYAPLSMRFPHAGRWTVALDDGMGRTLNYADGTVISTVNGPEGTPLDAAELQELGNPGDCVDQSSATGADEGSLALPVVIAIGAIGLVALALGLHRRRLA